MMNEAWKKTIAAYVDGETDYQDAAERLMATRPECAAYAEELRQIHAGIAAVIQRESIGDGQFNAFMAGIQEGIETPAPGYRGRWAALSFGAAALVMALAVWSMLPGDQSQVKATEVEYVDTELDDATVNWYNSEDGVPTIQLYIPEDDI
jgi:anti-sigma factor RsiW